MLGRVAKNHKVAEMEDGKEQVDDVIFLDGGLLLAQVLT